MWCTMTTKIQRLCGRFYLMTNSPPDNFLLTFIRVEYSGMQMSEAAAGRQCAALNIVRNNIGALMWVSAKKKS